MLSFPKASGNWVHEFASANVTAAQNYAATYNGKSIASGQPLTIVNTGSNTKVDLSGLRYGIGLRFAL